MVLYGLNENLRSYKSLKKGANFRLSPALIALLQYSQIQWKVQKSHFSEALLAPERKGQQY